MVGPLTHSLGGLRDGDGNGNNETDKTPGVRERESKRERSRRKKSFPTTPAGCSCGYETHPGVLSRLKTDLRALSLQLMFCSNLSEGGVSWREGGGGGGVGDGDGGDDGWCGGGDGEDDDGGHRAPLT